MRGLLSPSGKAKMVAEATRIGQSAHASPEEWESAFKMAIKLLLDRDVLTLDFWLAWLATIILAFGLKLVTMLFPTPERLWRCNSVEAKLKELNRNIFSNAAFSLGFWKTIFGLYFSLWKLQWKNRRSKPQSPTIEKAS